MKKTILIILPLLFIFACKNNKSENSSDRENIEDSIAIQVDTSVNEEVSIEELIDKDISTLNDAQIAVQTLLESCAKGDLSTAATIMAYTGSDESRIYNDNFNYSVSNEKMIVDITADVIMDWLNESESYEFISFEEMESEIGTLQVVEVMFKKQEVGINRRFFRLAETPNGLLLVAMD